MALDGCGVYLRYMAIVWNFVVMLAGVATVGVGVYMVVNKDSGQFVDDIVPGESLVTINYSEVSDSSMFAVMAYCLIGLGGFTVIVTMLGCLGSIRQKRGLLSFAFALQLLVFLALIGVGVYLYIKRDEIYVDEDKLYPLLKKTLQDAVQNFHRDEQSKHFMEAVQKKYDCCGANNGGGDYAPVFPLPCDVLHSNTPCLPPYFEYVVTKIGVEEFYYGKMTTGAGLAVGLAVLLIILMILTLVLCYDAGREV